MGNALRHNRGNSAIEFFFFFFQTNDLEVRAMTSDLEEGEISRVRVLGRKGPVEKSEGRGWSTVYVIEKNEIKRNEKSCRPY